MKSCFCCWSFFLLIRLDSIRLGMFYGPADSLIRSPAALHPPSRKSDLQSVGGEGRWDGGTVSPGILELWLL